VEQEVSGGQDDRGGHRGARAEGRESKGSH